MFGLFRLSDLPRRIFASGIMALRSGESFHFQHSIAFSEKRKRVFECDHVIQRHDFSLVEQFKNGSCLPCCGFEMHFSELHVVS